MSKSTKVVCGCVMAAAMCGGTLGQSEKSETTPVVKTLRTDPNYPSRTNLTFNRYYDYEQLTAAVKQLVDAYPELLTMQSLGKSVGGRDLWCVTVNNPATGPDTSKPAMFIDGNIHGNEIQAAETSLYSLWYMTKSYGQIEKLTQLMDRCAFYFVPTENPDGRDYWFHSPNDPHSSRTGIKPTDNDNDGLYDEDCPDDLDGDGSITVMWRQDPTGRFKRDPKDDRFFIRVEDDEAPGGWTFAGEEGIDNDGDGRINEDEVGGYDMNRNWPSDWQPNYIQFGAGDYPFSFPETRAIGDFLWSHPNIAAFQSYHNAGGMILVGPGANYVQYPGGDNRVMQMIQQNGEKMLPFYRAMVIWKDLYTVHGGEVNWAYEGLGILAITNELWTDAKMYYSNDGPNEQQQREYNDWLRFGEVYVPFTEHDHPTYGKVLIGGEKKWSSRVTPPFMLEEECHRNFAFTMYHADQMPEIAWGVTQVKRAPGNLWEVTVEVKNEKIIPTMMQIASQKGIGARDSITAKASDGKIVTSGTVFSLAPDAKLQAVERMPERIWNDNGIGTYGSRVFRFYVEGEGSIDFTYTSQKAGKITQTVKLEATE